MKKKLRLSDSLGQRLAPAEYNGQLNENSGV